MPKGEYQRKLRRVDYSKKEIAERLFCAENTVDSRIKQLCKDYDLPEGIFKRDGANGLNFFPPEYTPILIELLRNNADNPALPRARKHEKVMAEDVSKYYQQLISSIKANQEIPSYLNEWMEDMPWMRTAEDVSSLIGLLVTELQVFIHNTLDMQNVDVGQAIRMITQNLDIVNYRMFQGNRIYRMTKANNDVLKKENEEGLFLELQAMSEVEREEYFKEVPPARAIYNEYAGKLMGVESVRLDAQDLSLDQGLIATIKTLMRKGEANQLKNGRKMVLDEFTSDENRYSGVEEERKAYLEAMCDNILESLDHDCSPGELTFINGSENRWKCIAEKIKSGEKIGDVYHQGGVEKFCELFEKDYLEYFERIQQDDSMLRDIVSNFIGRLMVDYLFASNKK